MAKSKGEIEHLPAVKPEANGQQITTRLNGHGAIPVEQIVKDVQAGMSQWIFTTVPFDKNDVGTIARMVRIVRGVERKIKNLVGERIQVKHVVVHPATTVDEEGEVVPIHRICLIDADDKVVSSTALTVMNSINEYAAIAERSLPFDPPAEFIVHKKAGDKRGELYWLEPVA